MTYRANPRTPYVVCVRYQARDEPTVTYPQVARKRLCDALEIADQTQNNWYRLIGAGRPILTWLVIDVRDNAEYRWGIAHRFGETDGTDENGRACTRRGGGTLDSTTDSGRGGQSAQRHLGGARQRRAG